MDIEGIEALMAEDGLLDLYPGPLKERANR